MVIVNSCWFRHVPNVRQGQEIYGRMGSWGKDFKGLARTRHGCG